MNTVQLLWGGLLVCLATGLAGAAIGIMSIREPASKLIVRSVGVLINVAGLLFLVGAPLFVAGLQ